MHPQYAFSHSYVAVLLDWLGRPVTSLDIHASHCDLEDVGCPFKGRLNVWWNGRDTHHRGRAGKSSGQFRLVVWSDQ
jgi:hypothetical protein